jgi:hypothetical protein
LLEGHFFLVLLLLSIVMLVGQQVDLLTPDR